MYYGRITLSEIVQCSRYLILVCTLLAVQCTLSVEPEHYVIPLNKHVSIGQNFLKPIASLCTDESVTYFDLQTHNTSMSQSAGFVSIGLGYRNLLMPGWMSGCYMAYNGLRDVVGNTNLVNIGVEGVAPWLQVSINGYVSLDKWLGQIPREESFYLSSRVKQAIDCKLTWTFFDNMTPFVGGYYMGTQQAQNPIMGYVLGVQYQFDTWVSLEAKYTGSHIHNHISLGLRFETGQAPARGSQSNNLWKPVDRHLAPLVLWPVDQLNNVRNRMSSSNSSPILDRSAQLSQGSWGSNASNKQSGRRNSEAVSSPELGRSNISTASQGSQRSQGSEWYGFGEGSGGPDSSGPDERRTPPGTPSIQSLLSPPLGGENGRDSDASERNLGRANKATRAKRGGVKDRGRCVKKIVEQLEKTQMPTSKYPNPTHLVTEHQNQPEQSYPMTGLGITTPQESPTHAHHELPADDRGGSKPAQSPAYPPAGVAELPAQEHVASLLPPKPFVNPLSPDIDETVAYQSSSVHSPDDPSSGDQPSTAQEKHQNRSTLSEQNEGQPLPMNSMFEEAR